MFKLLHATVGDGPHQSVLKAACGLETPAPILNTSLLMNNPGGLLECVKPQVQNLGVIIFDPDLKCDKQMNSFLRRSFYQLRPVAKLKSFPSPQDLEKVIHALVSSHYACAWVFVSPQQLVYS